MQDEKTRAGARTTRGRFGWAAETALLSGDRRGVRPGVISARYGSLSRALFVVAALTLAVVLALLLYVLPTLTRSGAEQRTAISRLGQVQLLVSGAANDQRGFLLTGDEQFLVTMKDKSEQVHELVQQLVRTSSEDEARQLRSAIVRFETFERTHEEVLAHVAAGRYERAVELAQSTGRDQRKLAQAELADVEERVLANKAKQSVAEARVGELLGGALGLLAAFLVGAAFLVRRASRGEAEAASARRGAEKTLESEQRSVALLQALTEAGDDLSQAFLVCLRGICEGAGWDVGHAYVSQDGRVWGSSDSWWLSDSARYEAVVAVTASRPIPQWQPGAGREVQVHRVVDAGDDARLSEPAVAKLGLRQAVIVTAPVGAGVGAVLEFFTQSSAAPDDQMVAVLHHAAAHLQRLLERDRATEQLRELALHDPLTGLANRALLRDRLEHAVAAGRQRVDVLLLDLDDFKNVNDVLGHAAGDVLLVEIARRLLVAAGPAATVARLGGDEFAVVLEDCDDPELVARKVIEVLNVPVEIEGREVVPQGSVGIATCETGASASELLRTADIAMYAAKRAGKNQHMSFRLDMTAALVARADLELALRAGIADDEILPFYQPIIDTRAERVGRVEVLVRWQRAAGVVSPGEFLPLAEETGLIVAIGAAVLRQASRDLQSWLNSEATRSFAVNASIVELRRPQFAREVLATLTVEAVSPGRLVIEVTESLFLDGDATVLRNLLTLRKAGVRVAIDDFGTGYSSLGRLQALPVDELKIDKSFVDVVATGREPAPILTSMIAMAHNLGLPVTAEGVETVDQAARLAALGCEHLQGFYFGRPQPHEQFATVCVEADRLAKGGGIASDRDAKTTVLVIDDDVIVRLLIRAALSDANLEVYEAASATAGMNVMTQIEPDCVLVGLGLADIDPFELVARLRSDLSAEATPILVLVGAADEETKARTFTAGADGYLVKPFTPQDLVARVRALTAHRDTASARTAAAASPTPYSSARTS